MSCQSSPTGLQFIAVAAVYDRRSFALRALRGDKTNLILGLIPQKTDPFSMQPPPKHFAGGFVFQNEPTEFFATFPA
jgi:hypothetical protein